MALGIVALLIVVASALVLGGQTASSAEEKPSFAYIDTVRLWNELPQMNEMRAALEEETQKKQAAYDAEAAKLEDEEARRKLFQKYQDELEAQKDAMLNQVLERTYQLIKKVAEEQGFDVVLERQSVLYGGYDLTDAVLEAAQN